MLSKKNRIDRKGATLLFKEGKLVSSPIFTFKFLFKEHTSPPRISFVVPKNIAKLAVKRNSLRRKGYLVLKKYLNNFPLGLVGVFVFKKYQEDLLVLENEIENCLNKIH